jgi:predicted transcriptional regulator
MDGRAYRYLPARSREQYVAQLLSSVLDDAGDAGDRTAALLRFVDRMSTSEVTALRRALDEYDTRRQPK